MAKYDLTSTLGQYLDRHLVFPLLEFISARQIYDEKELLQAKLDMLSKTNMVDYAIDIRNQLHPDEDIPEEMKKQRAQVVRQLAEMQSKVALILQIISNDTVVEEMENARDSETFVKYLINEYSFNIDMMENLYSLAKYRYECGNYAISSSYLYFYMIVMPSTDKNYLSLLWGKLASEILIQNWDSAMEDLIKLREYIDNTAFEVTTQLLQQRTWLIHWSLFVFYTHPKGKDQLIDMFLYRPDYLNAIETSCPHILRYLATAVITSPKRRGSMKDLVRVVQQESYKYRDPITEFLEALYIDFDLDGAQQKLRECQIVLFNDFFLTGCLQDFVENARILMFEMTCRIYQRVSISKLAEKLGMASGDTERWLVDLIRDERLEARIDSRLEHVVKVVHAPSPFQQLATKVEALTVRSEGLSNLVERKITGNSQDSRWNSTEF